MSDDVTLASTTARIRRGILNTDAVELGATILLAVAAVATAWSSYQATRWSGEQTVAFSTSNAARTEASRVATRADQLAALDASTFIAWADAYATDEQVLAQFYWERFRAEFKPAMEAWVATEPLKNPDAPLTPFVMPEYQLADRALADELDAKAAEQTELAKTNNQRADNYVLAVVLFASSLFFAGISTKMARLSHRASLLGIGYALFLGTLAWVATFPVSFQI